MHLGPFWAILCKKMGWKHGFLVILQLFLVQKLHVFDLKITIFSQKWSKNRFWIKFFTHGYWENHPKVCQKSYHIYFWVQKSIFWSFLAKNREFQVRIVTFWTRNSCKITKNTCFYTILLHKIAQKGAQMYVETSSIHQYRKIWINSIETFLSTFEFSQSHIISYLPKSVVIQKNQDLKDYC